MRRRNRKLIYLRVHLYLFRFCRKSIFVNPSHLRDLADEPVLSLDLHRPQLLPLPVQQVEGGLGAETDFNRTLGALMEPLLDVHLVGLKHDFPNRNRYFNKKYTNDQFKNGMIKGLEKIFFERILKKQRETIYQLKNFLN